MMSRLTGFNAEYHYRRMFGFFQEGFGKARVTLEGIMPFLSGQKEHLAAEIDRYEELCRGLTFEQYMETRESRGFRAAYPYVFEWAEVQRTIREAALPRICLADCQHGHVYRLASRNLLVGAYNLEREGFVGIRVKFDVVYLFTEYHWDYTGGCATARPLEDLGALPEGIEPVTHFPQSEVSLQGNPALFHYLEPLNAAEAIRLREERGEG